MSIMDKFILVVRINFSFPPKVQNLFTEDRLLETRTRDCRTKQLPTDMDLRENSILDVELVFFYSRNRYKQYSLSRNCVP
jgi:hypothetical protein